MTRVKIKAVKCPKYGPPEVLQLVEIDKPKPKDNEILVKIKATAVTASDVFIRSGDLPLRYKILMRLFIGIFKPRRSVIGLVFSGVVESIGKEILNFTPGEEVYGMTGFNLGAYAEYTCVKESCSTTGVIALKPKNISHEDATTAVYGGSLAMQYLDKAHIKPNQHILIYGASGTSGLIAVQYAKFLGAIVTAVCSGKNAELVKSLGADQVIDYTVTDYLDTDIKFDTILDSVGKLKNSLLKENCRNALKKEGKYISIDDGSLVLCSDRLTYLENLIQHGIIKPFTGKTYKLEDIVEAHRYVQKGHKTGGVAITVSR